MVGWLSYRCCLGRRRAPRRAFVPLHLKRLALFDYELYVIVEGRSQRRCCSQKVVGYAFIDRHVKVWARPDREVTTTGSIAPSLLLRPLWIF